MHMENFRTSLVYLFLFLPFVLGAQLPAEMIQYPSISKDKICFTYGDDLWIVNKEGGTAHRLTTTAGRETTGIFSPDGKTIAFNANYDGGYDIYTIPVTGGTPFRVTTHGMAEFVKGWSKDGKELIFTSSMKSGKQRWSQAYTISKEGGLPTKLPMEKVSELDFHENGELIAMTDKSRLFRTWKRYRGGTAPDIYLFNTKTLTSENITNNIANDELPMWSGDILYYLSDQDKHKKFNIWKYDLNTKQHSQVTNFTNFDIRFPSMGDGEMVFEAGGELYKLNLTSQTSEKIDVHVLGDFTEIKPVRKNVKNYMQNIEVSADGNRVVVEARGELFSVPGKEGITRNLTNSSGTAERYPSWSPNGKFIAYWSDKTGEYELNIKDLTDGTVKQIGKEGPGFRYNLHWSPDNEKIVFVDQEMNIRIADIENNTITKVDQEISLFEGGLRGFSIDWSSDSRYFTYTNTHDNLNSIICVYDTKEAKKHVITSAFYNDANPVFSADDKFIYCTTDRVFEPVYSDFDNSWIYPNATKLGMIPLTKDIENPIEIKNDTVAIVVKEDKKDEKEDKEKEEDDKEEDDQEEGVKIDFDNIESRMVVLPVELGNTGGIAAAKDKLIYVKSPRSGSKGDKAKLMYYDFGSDEEKTIIEGVRGFEVSANKEKILVYQGGNWGIIDVGEGQKMEDPIDLSNLNMLINPREEWHQIFDDVWRFERDMFYDKEMHGVDWEAMKEKYKPLIDHAASRYDVNFVIGELIGEMNASHTYRGGGDSEYAKYVGVGYLGVDYKLTNGKYQIAKIIEGAAWDTEVKSPLKDIGNDINEGDYVLAVNGMPISESFDPNAALQGMAGKTVELTISKTGMESDAKTYLVKPLSDETRLRNLAWIEENRKYVDEKSGGRIGYIYVPSTGIGGQDELVRMFYAQHHKDGLIIDERFNNGGQIPDRFVELLNRPLLSYYKTRVGKDWAWPPKGHYGPKAMLINGWSGSGGDAFPDYFRKRGLGPLIGSRTWGGLIGISGSPRLIDGGGVTVPTFRMYHLDGTWFEEGHGVDPDIEVPENPGLEAQGKDVQLDKAIEHVLGELKEMDKKPKLKVPEAEDRSK